MRILHLVEDWIFTDGPVAIFNSLPVENKFVVLRDNDDKTLVKVKSDKVDVVKVGSLAYQDLLFKEKWDLVWVFQLDSRKSRFVMALAKKIPVVWSVYGVDYIRYSGLWLYGLRTTLLFFKFSKLRLIILTLGAYFAGKLRIVRFIPRLECRFFNRINYFSCIVPEEEPWLRNVIGWRKTAKLVKFNYCSPRSTTDTGYPLIDLSAKNIWVGNSCTLSNNHLDVFKRIFQVPCIHDYNVFVPLSYCWGNEEGLDKIIISKGKRMFGERFMPITEFIAYNEYKKLMSSCSIFIFGMKRQQALGNILIALMCGGCVFLDTKNPVYKHYINMGVVVYPLERIVEGFDTILAEFKPHQKKNIEIISQLRSNECLINEINETVEYLKNEICGK